MVQLWRVLKCKSILIHPPRATPLQHWEKYESQCSPRLLRPQGVAPGLEDSSLGPGYPKRQIFRLGCFTVIIWVP